MNDESPQKQLDKSFSLTRGEQAREWGAAPPPADKKPVDSNSPKCASCSRYHGGVNDHINCLRRGIAQRDQQIADLKVEMEALRTRVRLERAGRDAPPSPATECDGAIPPPADPALTAAVEAPSADAVAPTESRAEYLSRRAGASP